MRTGDAIPESKTHVLNDVYNYEPGDQKNRNSKEQKLGQAQKKNLGQGRPEEKFENCFGGLVKYNRHFLQHAGDYVEVEDPRQIEIYFSQVFGYLPELLLLLSSEGFFTEARYVFFLRVSVL